MHNSFFVFWEFDCVDLVKIRNESSVRNQVYIFGIEVNGGGVFFFFSQRLLIHLLSWSTACILEVLIGKNQGIAYNNWAALCHRDVNKTSFCFHAVEKETCNFNFVHLMSQTLQYQCKQWQRRHEQRRRWDECSYGWHACLHTQKWKKWSCSWQNAEWHLPGVC